MEKKRKKQRSKTKEPQDHDGSGLLIQQEHQPPVKPTVPTKAAVKEIIDFPLNWSHHSHSKSSLKIMRDVLKSTKTKAKPGRKGRKKGSRKSSTTNKVEESTPPNETSKKLQNTTEHSTLSKLLLVFHFAIQVFPDTFVPFPLQIASMKTRQIQPTSPSSVRTRTRIPRPPFLLDQALPPDQTRPRRRPKRPAELQCLRANTRTLRIQCLTGKCTTCARIWPPSK